MKNLTQLEREYFVRKVGGALPTEPLENLKRRYFVSFLAGSYPVSSSVSIGELESNWLIKVIVDAGGTVNDEDDYSALWKIAVVELGKTPSKYLADNQKIFFLHAP